MWIVILSVWTDSSGMRDCLYTIDNNYFIEIE